MGEGSSSFNSDTLGTYSPSGVCEFKARRSASLREILNRQALVKNPEEGLVSVPNQEILSIKLSKSDSSKVPNSSPLDGKQDTSIDRVSASISNLPLKRIDPSHQSKGSNQGEDGAKTMQTDSSEEQMGVLESLTNDMLVEARGGRHNLS
ncbi:hypothetical protein ACJW30_06G062800 [Castanea mollissima]